MKTLILGGARSGKSRYAEQILNASPKSKIYLATGEAKDLEMQNRIAEHQKRRDSTWKTIEEPLHLAQTIQGFNNTNTIILVDCLTLWLSNCLHKKCFEQEKAALVSIVQELNCDIVFVSNEVGSGVVPLGELSRQFVDQSGWLHQALAEYCETVTLVVAGLPLPLKKTGR